MPTTIYFKTLMTKVILGEQAYPATNYYVGLLYNGTETTDINYERLPVALTNQTTSATNTSKKTFAPAAGAYTFNQVGLFDAKSGGNLLFYDAYGTTQVTAGQRIIIDPGDLTVSP